MNRYKLLGILLFFSCLTLAPSVGFSQITSTTDQFVLTEYSSGAQDKIYIFCGEKDELNASLIASYPNGETGNFEWQKYNQATNSFEFYSTDQSGMQTSSIPNLANGCYRVKITPASGPKTYTAWVFNNYIDAKAEIPESECAFFKLKGTFESPALKYVDLTNGLPKELLKDIQVKWSFADGLVSRVETSTVVNPPAKNTVYTFEVTDRFGCVGKADVTYISIVTKASFDVVKAEQKYDKNLTEAPLTVTFINNSENGESGKFEWFILKVLEGTKDSVVDIIYNDTPPSYTFEETGTYKLKLVSKHATCTDTISEFELDGKIQKEIVFDASFIDAPDLFMPEKLNPTFAVMFFSMKSVKITIFNRWGKVLHVWESNNVQGFYNTAETVPQSVWDGKVGGRNATPGVYFWVAEGIGRDGKKRTGNGFFHLFR